MGKRRRGRWGGSDRRRLNKLWVLLGWGMGLRGEARAQVVYTSYIFVFRRGASSVEFLIGGETWRKFFFFVVYFVVYFLYFVS